MVGVYDRGLIEPAEDVLSAKGRWGMFEYIVEVLADVWEVLRQREQLNLVDQLLWGGWGCKRSRFFFGTRI